MSRKVNVANFESIEQRINLGMSWETFAVVTILIVLSGVDTFLPS